MSDPRIQLKDPLIAGLLAWLIPGAGHLYQGRLFKAVIYATCILGLFLTGWAMADWSAVQAPDLRNPRGNYMLLLKYTAQFGVGLPAVYALVQNERSRSPANVPVTTIAAPVEADFTGVFLDESFPRYGGVNTLLQVLEDAGQHVDEQFLWPLDRGQPAQGRISLKPIQTELGTDAIEARFSGEIQGAPANLKLDYATLEEPIRASPRRRVFALARDPQTDQVRGILVASIPRPFLNYVGVRMTPREENQLNARHGNFLEIWTVFTWIAGLLNVLVIWDACQGPAYAYGDEVPEDEGSDKEAPATATV